MEQDKIKEYIVWTQNYKLTYSQPTQPTHTATPELTNKERVYYHWQLRPNDFTHTVDYDNSSSNIDSTLSHYKELEAMILILAHQILHQNYRAQTTSRSRKREVSNTRATMRELRPIVDRTVHSRVN